jgi:O-antigen/teichoic acid export membrane protein
MRRIALFSLLLALAVVVVGISFALMRNLHQPLLVYVIVMPIWVTLLVILAMVARLTFRGRQNGGSQ